MGFAWPFLLDALTPFGAMEGLPAIEITRLNIIILVSSLTT